MPYLIGRFGGPVDDFKAKLAEFDSLNLAYLAAVSGQHATKRRLDLAWSRASVLPKSSERDKLLSEINALRAQAKEDAGGGRWASIIARARDAISNARKILAKLRIPGFGAIDPISLSVVAASVATVVLALSAMRTFLSRDKRLKDELTFRERKLDALRQGVSPEAIAAIDKPADKPGLLPDLGELVGPAVAIAALVLFGPALFRKVRG